MRIAAQKVLFNILFLSLTLSSLANPPDFSEIIARRFSKIWYLAPQEKVYLHTDKPNVYSAGDDIWFRAHLVNATTFQPNTKSNFVYVELIDKADSIHYRVKIKKEGTGLSGKISLSPSIASGEYVLRAYTYWMQNATPDFFFHKKMYIGNTIDDRMHDDQPLGSTSVNKKSQAPSIENDFNLQFFPESGVFLDNQIQTIAYKTVGTNGFSCNIIGKVFNNQQEEITTLKSFHKGMGKVVIRTNPGESYYAIVQNDAGIVKRVELPATTSEGIALKIGTNLQTSFFSVMNQTTIPTSSLFLMVHVRGMVFMVSPLLESEGHFSTAILPAGIASYTIIDSLGNAYCERLNFIRNFEFPSITMQSDKANYTQRELVHLNFSVTTLDSLPAKGNFSVSVTDSHLVQSDSINDNILSYLLLSGDVKGFIEEPQIYFKDNSAVTKERTNLLMLTQGWRRFNTADILKAKYTQPAYYMEVGQSITGKVLNLFNKPVKNSEIIYLSDYKNQIITTKSDSTGQFLIEGIQFPDSSHIILKAKSKSKIVDVELIADEDIFPTTSNKVLFHDFPTKMQDAYFNLAKEKYYNERGMLVINLDEITVNAKAKTASSDYFYSGMADNTIDAATLERNPGARILDIISMMPGVQVVGQNVRVRGARQGPMFLVDGIETDSVDDIEYLSAYDVEEIALFKGPSTSVFGLRGGNGVIAITLKKGVSIQSTSPPSLAHLSPLGYQKPSEFYVPAYEVDSIFNSLKTDLRTTIYWAPQVQTDEQGTLQLQFYTADKTNDYNVELEGVTEKGEICRYKGVLKRK